MKSKHLIWIILPILLIGFVLFFIIDNNSNKNDNNLPHIGLNDTSNNTNSTNNAIFNSDSAEFYLSIADSFYKNKNYTKANFFAFKSFNFDSQYVPITLITSSYILDKKIDSAIIFLKDIYFKSDKFPNIYKNLISVLIEKHDFNEAYNIGKTKINEGIPKDTIIDIFKYWTSYFFEKKDNVAVIRLLEKIILYEPNNPEIIKYLAESYYNAGVIKKAEYYFERYSKLKK